MSKWVQCRGSNWSNVEVDPCPECVLIKSGEVLSTVKEVTAKKRFFPFFGRLKMSNDV